MKQRIAVIGAGVVGSAVFESLTEAGHEVTLYDKDAPGSGSSSASFAWINSNNKVPKAYFDLNNAALQEHARRRERGSAAFFQTGYYELASSEEHVDRLRDKVRRLTDWDYDARVLSREQVSLELPALAEQAVGSVNVFFPQEGYCDVHHFIAECLGRGKRNGGRFVLDEVVEVEAHRGRRVVHRRDGAREEFDRVILAGGRWTQKLAETCGIRVPMSDAHSKGAPNLGFLAITKPAPVLIDSVVTTSTLSFRPEGHGRLLLQYLQLDSEADPFEQYTKTGPVAEEFNRQLFSTLNTGFPVLVDEIKVGYRPLTKDGLTIAGFADSAETVYVIATHSAVTLAPLLAQYAAAEVSGKEVPALEPFRPSRFNNHAPDTGQVVPAERLAGNQ